MEFARQMEAAGLSFLTVHGRTKEERCEPVNLTAIALIKSAVRVPVVANGDVKSLQNAYDTQTATKVDGKFFFSLTVSLRECCRIPR